MPKFVTMKNYRHTARFKAKRMIREIRTRCNKRGMAFNLDYEWVATKAEYGKCEQTGIPFIWDADQKRSPFAFSIDRIDSARGYTKDNCQAVVWAYNAAKAEGTDADVMHFAKALTTHQLEYAR